MSRIGKKPIPVPGNVTVTVDGPIIRVKGPKGELTRVIRQEITVEQKDGELVLDAVAPAELGPLGPRSRARHARGHVGHLLRRQVAGDQVVAQQRVPRRW